MRQSLFFFSEANLKEQVETSFNLPPTYETLVSRAQLASVSFICPILFYDSHVGIRIRKSFFLHFSTGN